MEILPGVLEKEFVNIEKKFEILRPFARVIHVDLLDGKFAPNTTLLDPSLFAKYSKDFFLEVHMMVDEPINYLNSFAKVGFRRFIGHVEKMGDQSEFIARAEALGEVCLGIDLNTPIQDIKVPLVDLDGVLLMTVKAGFSGQKFDPMGLSKVKELRERDALLPLEIDGGVNEATIIQGKEAGATRFVATSYIFSSENPAANYHKLQNLLTS